MTKALKPQHHRSEQIGDEAPMIAIMLVIGIAIILLMFWWI
jgi:hypothetical protein